MNIGIALAILAIAVLLVAGYVTWRDRRRDEDAEREATARAWGETAGGEQEQAQRPIWRPERDE